MLKLILGRQGTGKTYNCIKIAEQVALSGGQAVMLVPEQFSFECQRHLLETLGPKISNRIEIHSFTSLCEAICDVYGGTARQNVDDATRYILIGQALKNTCDSLKLYGKYVGSSSFVREMMSVITELKQSSITAEQLFALADKVESELFSGKLYDSAVILSAYDALLENRFLDPHDLINNTVQNMRDNLFFSGKTFIVDEFKGFTESQFKLLDRIVAGSRDCVVSLCCDSLIPDSDTDIFKNIKSSATRLILIAQAHCVEVAQPLILSDMGSNKNGLTNLERFLAEKELDSDACDVDNATIVSADSIYSEIDFVMNTIRKNVRENGYRYRDFVIVSRTDNTYSKLIEEFSEIYGIPCYTDQRVSALTLPFSVVLISAVNAAISLDTEEILRLIKTGLLNLSLQEINSLENYVYIWSISGKKWLEGWSMNASGLKDTSKNNIEKTEKQLFELNALRKRIIEPLQKLRNNLNGTAENMCRALLHFIDECGVIENLRSFTSSLTEAGKLNEAEYQRSGYDVAIKTFDKIISAFGESTVTVREFADVLKSALCYETVGEIPQTQDQVIYGTADRIRPMRPRVVFVIGVNQDIFPAAVNDSGLFSQSERELMLSSGLAVADRSVSDCLDEKYLLYSACTCASEKVYISYSKASASGSAMEPSVEIDAIIKAFPSIKVLKIDTSFSKYDIETPESTFRRLAESFLDESDIAHDVKAYFSECESYSHRIKSLNDYLAQSSPSLNSLSVDRIFGQGLELSASKADDFANCRFMYFCKYGIGAKRIARVDFDPLTRGNIVHDCLESFINAHKSDIGLLLDDDINRETAEFCDEYINKNCTDAAALDDKFRYMLDVTKETVAYLARALNSEFAVSSFKPKYCELKVGADGLVDGISVLTERGQRVVLNGYVDRVDTTPDGKLRVIDYKTGSKGDTFKLAELLSGHNMQMLLYLYSILKNGQELIGASIPAGVLYFPAKRRVSDEVTKYIKMNGIVLNDIDTVKQMEPEGGGKIIPPHITSSGNSFYKTDTLIPEEAFKTVFSYIELLLQKIGNTVMNGEISPKPLKIKDDFVCKYCDYKAVCRFDPYLEHNESVKCNNFEAIEMMKKELGEEADGN